MNQCNLHCGQVVILWQDLHRQALCALRPTTQIRVEDKEASHSRFERAMKLTEEIQERIDDFLDQADITLSGLLLLSESRWDPSMQLHPNSKLESLISSIAIVLKIAMTIVCAPRQGCGIGTSIV